MASQPPPPDTSLELISIATAAAGRSVDMYNSVITEFLNVTNESYSSSNYKTIKGKAFLPRNTTLPQHPTCPNESQIKELFEP